LDGTSGHLDRKTEQGLYKAGLLTGITDKKRGGPQKPARRTRQSVLPSIPPVKIFCDNEKPVAASTLALAENGQNMA
jgi:hypothetical protein